MPSTMALALESSILPLFTTLVGTGGLTVGIYSFLNPIAAARIYGVPVRTSNTTLTSVLVPNPTIPQSESEPIYVPSTQDLSFIHALGIRNLTAGLTIVSLTSFWHFFLPSTSTPEAVRGAIQHAIGIVILIGSCVPMIDAWVCWRHSQQVYTIKKSDGHRNEPEKDRKGAQSSRSRSGADWEREAYETGRKAGNLHAARSLVLVFGGLWCLLG